VAIGLIALLLGGVLRGSSPAGSAVIPQAARTSYVVDDAPAGGTAAQIARLQTTLAADRNDVSALDQLALAYQQRARETGDPAYYTKSGEALHRALKLAPNDLLATSGLGSLALSRHRFREALDLG